MKIHFEVRDGNYKSITKRYGKLIELSEMYWSNSFSRTQLSVFFIKESEFSEHERHCALQSNNVENGLNHKNPETEIMGMYFSFHEKSGPDVVLICPQRIDDISKKCDLSFNSLLDKVFTHELAHSLMTKDVFSLSEASLYQIPSFKFFEESLCNAFALLHFNNKKRELLKTFCRSQSSGYCDFHIWGDSFKNISSSMDNYKSLKGDCHYWINCFWFSTRYDFLLKNKGEVEGRGTAHLNYHINNIAKQKYTSSDNYKDVKLLVYSLLTLKDIVLDGSLFSHDMRKSVAEACCSFGFRIIEGTQYLLIKKEETVCNRYICLDVNGVSIFSIEKDILKNIRNDNLNIISLINV